MLPQVDGCAVVTARGWSGPTALPHPAQRALADTHGTQCGFCSPGFAIALAALSRRPERDDETILDAIAGNLCRCTGYQPILQAARALPVTEATPEEAAMAVTLCADCAEPLDYQVESRRFVAPHSLDAFLATLEDHPDAWILSGGTDLGLRVTKRHEEPACVLSLARIPELHEIRRDKTDTTIGAAVSYADALEAVTALAPSFGEMVRRIGAAQIRAMGTFGGNIANASPIGDSLPPLIALGATVETVSHRGRGAFRSRILLSGTARPCWRRAKSSPPCGCPIPPRRCGFASIRSPGGSTRTSRRCPPPSPLISRAAGWSVPVWPTAAWRTARYGRATSRPR